MQFYTKLLTALVAATAATGIGTSIGVYYGVTSAFQATLATIVVAFAGFIFGGLYPFVLEGRRMQWRDREERIRKYHKKLREHVFDFWSSRTIEPRMKLDKLLESRESLYIFLDLGSDRDPDGRYLKDSISHLKDEPYKKTGDERESILDEVKSHNEKVLTLVKMNLLILENAKALGLREVNVSPMDKLEDTSELFNRAGVIDFLDSSYDYPSETKLKTDVQLAGYCLSYDRQTLTFTIARSLHKKTIQALSNAISEFVLEYIETRKALNAKMTSLQSDLAVFKGDATTIGHDIDDEEFGGTCEYETRTRKIEPP